MERTARAATIQRACCRHMSLLALCVLALSLLLAPPLLLASSAQSVTSLLPAVQFGQTAVFSGTNSELGRDMRRGIRTAFKMANERPGAVHGRELSLLSLDDGYDPALALINARTLVNSTVFALLGTVGTPTATAMLPLLTSARVPLVGPFTGARFLREPYKPYVLNYDDEMAAFVQYCLQRGLTLFSLLYQADSYGLAGYDALDVSLQNHGLSILSSASYERNTLEVEQAWLTLREGPRPDVCVMIGTARPMAIFVSMARAPHPSSAVGGGGNQSWDGVLFGTVSFVGAEVFASELLEANTTTENVVITQVMPPPFSLAQLQHDVAMGGDPQLLRSSSLLFQFAQALENHCTPADQSESAVCEASFGTFEGYVVGNLVVEILQRMGPITPRSVLQYISAEQTADFYDPSLADDEGALEETRAWLRDMADMSQADAPPFFLNDTRVAPFVRDQFLNMAYSTGLFVQGGARGLQYGPLVPEPRCAVATPVLPPGNASMPSPAGPGQYIYDATCFATHTHEPCNQLSFAVYVSTITRQNVTGLPAFVYREDVAARTAWHQCGVHSRYLPVESRPLVFGQTAAFSGPSRDEGIQMRRGIRAAFEAANRSPSGGVRQRALLLTSYDDGDDEAQAVKNVANMVNRTHGRNGILALVGVTGTATSTRILQSGLLNTTGRPIALMGSTSGARALRSPFLRHVINFRSSFDDEMAAQLAYLKRVKGGAPLSIFLLREDDAIGEAGETALLLALKYHKMSLACNASYPRHSTDVDFDIEQALDTLKLCGTPGAVVMVGKSHALAHFVHKAEEHAPWHDAGIIYTSLSSVGSELPDLLPPDFADSGRMLVSEVVPPVSTNEANMAAFPILDSFVDHLAFIDSSPPTEGALEGYLVGLLVVFAADRSLRASSSSFVDAIYAAHTVDLAQLHLGPSWLMGPFEDNLDEVPFLGGVEVPNCNQGSRSVYLTSLPNRAVVDVFQTGHCGVLQAYEDAPCELGWQKIYKDFNTSLESTCVPCLPGFFGPDGLSCFACPTGQFSDSNAATSCTACPKSTFQDRVGQDQCLPCLEDSYAPYANTSQCIRCEPNAWTEKEGASGSDQCKCRRGYFSAVALASSDGLPPERVPGEPVVVVNGQDAPFLQCTPCPNSRWSHEDGECQLPQMSSNTTQRIVLAVLAGVVILLCIACAVLVWRWRELKAIKAATPSMMILMCIGGILALLIPILSVNYPLSSRTCQAQLYLGHIAWTLIFGSAMLKCHRLHVIFLTVQAKAKLRVVAVTNKLLFKYLIALLAAQLVYLSVWQGLHPVSSQVHRTETLEFRWCAQSPDGSDLWPLLLILWDAVILFYATYLCVQIRNFTGLWNESKQLAVVSYNTTLLALLTLMAVFFLVEDENAFTLLISLVIIFVVLIMLAVLFIYKFFLCKYGEMSGTVSGNSAQTTAPSSSGTEASVHRAGEEYSFDPTTAAISVEMVDHDALTPGQVRLLKAQLSQEQARVKALQERLRGHVGPSAAPSEPPGSVPSEEAVASPSATTPRLMYLNPVHGHGL